MTISECWRCAQRAATALAIAGLALTGCGGGGGGGGGDSGPSREEQILSAIEKAGKVVPLGPDSDDVTGTEEREEGDFRNTYEHHDAIANLENVAYLGLNDDLIWPGALVKGTHAHQFVFEPISMARGPITLSVSLEGSGSTGPLSVQVADPKLSTVRQGIADLLRGAVTPGTTVPARVDYREEQVSNESHMNLFVGADVKYGAGSLDTRFDWNSVDKRTKILVKYTQIYYTVDLDTPTSPLAFVGASASPADVAAAMPADSMPLYVATVGYGMMAVMCIETDFTEEEMKLALDAAYSGAVDAKVKFGYSARDILEKSSITIIVYGGSTKGLGDIETGYAGFQKVIEASQQYGPDTPGVPIFYKFRHVADNTLTLVSLTSQYTLVRPLQLRQRVLVTIQRYVCEMADDEGTDNTVDMDYFNARAWGYVRQDVGTPEFLVNPSEVDQWIYQYGGADIAMNPGGVVNVDQSLVVVFPTDVYDFSLARLRLYAHARDDDGGWSNPENAENTTDILGDALFANGGTHNLWLYSGDFTMRAEFRVSDYTH